MEQNTLEKQLEGLSTEEKIKVAAKHVFIEKGFEGTKTRDITEALKINIASLHYYFRNKENLFDIIMEETMMDFSKLMDSILNTQDPLHVKIRRCVEEYTDFLIANPFIPMFILNEGNKNPERINQMMNDAQHLPLLRQQIKDEIASGNIIEINLENFIANLFGLIVFPFLSQPLMKLKTGINEKEFQKMLQERKKLVPDMIIKYLYLKAL